MNKMGSAAKAAFGAAAGLTAMTAGLAQAQQAPAVDMKAADARAAATVRQMTADEKVVLTHGIMPLPLGGPTPPIPADAIAGAATLRGSSGWACPRSRKPTPALACLT